MLPATPLTPRFLPPVHAAAEAVAARRYVSALRAGDTAEVLAARTWLRVEPGTDPAALATIREAVVWYRAGELPRRAGAYLIASGDQVGGLGGGGLVYLGCARDIYARFHHEKYGHLQPGNKTRSAAVLEGSDARFAVVAFAAGGTDDQVDRQMATQEVFWYLLARRAGLNVVNSVGNLGRTSGGDGVQWLVASSVDGTTHHLFRSQAEAGRVLGVAPGALSKVVRAEQNQTNGWALRPAAPEEVVAYESGVPAEACVTGPAEVSWVDGRMFWSSGRLSSGDLGRLEERSRRPYNRGQRSRYWGVRRAQGRETWEAYVVVDAAARSNWRSLGRDFPDEDAAAAAREEVLTGDAVLASLNRRNDAVGRSWGAA